MKNINQKTNKINEENIFIQNLNFNKISKTLDGKEKFKIWIKTLLESYKTFPEIIKTLDKIIELQASTISFMTDIYNSSNTTFSHAEEIINLSERKSSILNIYLMLQNILKNTSTEDHEFLEKKFLSKYTINELSEEYGVSQRTIYRKTEKIIEEICKKCLAKNWSLRFIESQIKDEKWLIEKYKKNLTEYLKSSGTLKNLMLYNRSSSESYVGKVG